MKCEMGKHRRLIWYFIILSYFSLAQGQWNSKHLLEQWLMDTSRSSLIQIININNWFLGGNHFREGSIITGNQIGGSRTSLASMSTSPSLQTNQNQFARFTLGSSILNFPMKSTSLLRTNGDAIAHGIVGGVRSRNPMKLSTFDR